MNNEKQNPAKDLQADANGNVILHPVTGWIGGPVLETSVLLALRYIARPEEFESEHQQVQLVLMPQQALELSEALRTWANQILAPSRKPPN